MAAPKLPVPSMIPETVERAFLLPLIAGFFPFKKIEVLQMREEIY